MFTSLPPASHCSPSGSEWRSDAALSWGHHGWRHGKLPLVVSSHKHLAGTWRGSRSATCAFTRACPDVQKDLQTFGNPDVQMDFPLK